MCLTNFGEKLIATENIIVYKHIIQVDNNIYISSYQYSDIVFNIIMKTKIHISGSVITEGFHSYVNIEDARDAALSWEETLVECIIPSGSEYYLGKMNQSNKDNIVSNAIIYKKIYND